MAAPAHRVASGPIRAGGSFDDDPETYALAWGLGLIGLLYPAMALAGWMRGQFSAGIGLLLIFLVVRSAFLGTLENPEPRYTLECYPVVIFFASAAFATYSKNGIPRP